MAKGRRGRPAKASARRRQTTRAGRAAPPDFGPAEVQRLRRILNPGQPGLPADPLSALRARDFIDERQYQAGRYFGALVAISRRGWNLADGSVAYAYRRMVAGIVGEEAGSIPVPEYAANGHDRSAADHARDTLERMRSELWRPGEDGAVYQAVMSTAVDCAWRPWLKRLLVGGGWGAGGGPQAQDYRHLSALKEGLFRLAEFGSARRREVSGERLAAE
jgi:hypothetical protein